jgi:succinyl-CoA synthetase beta subunit
MLHINLIVTEVKKFFEPEKAYTGAYLMNLLEHRAKTLLAEHDLPLPQSWLVHGANIPEAITYPVVAKSQVPVGGRGKAGGIQVVHDAKQLPEILRTLFDLDIKGHKPNVILLEEQLSPSRELYLSLRLNRDSRSLEWLASSIGGVEIEDNAGSVRTVAFGQEPKLADALSVNPAQLEPVLNGLIAAFFNSDLTLLEINPLIEQTDGSLVIADAKVTVDDNARFRQPGLPWPDTAGSNLKPLGGTIGTIANGAGMAMSTMDTIVAAGGKPANFLDIGGGTGEKQFVEALKNIVALPGVTSIIINIFAGISRCDEIARGIIAAREQIPNLPPLFIRLEGTNRDIAVELLNEANIAIEPSLAACVAKALQTSNQPTTQTASAEPLATSGEEASAFPAGARQDQSAVSAERASETDGGEKATEGENNNGDSSS